jgi:hypothetical protein
MIYDCLIIILWQYNKRVKTKRGKLMVLVMVIIIIIIIKNL